MGSWILQWNSRRVKNKFDSWNHTSKIWFDNDIGLYGSGTSFEISKKMIFGNEYFIKLILWTEVVRRDCFVKRHIIWGMKYAFWHNMLQFLEPFQRVLFSLKMNLVGVLIISYFLHWIKGERYIVFLLDSHSQGFSNWYWLDCTVSQSKRYSLEISQSQAKLKASTWKPVLGIKPTESDMCHIRGLQI